MAVLSLIAVSATDGREVKSWLLAGWQRKQQRTQVRGVNHAPSNRNLKKQKFCTRDNIGLLGHLNFSRNQPLKSADD
jgi:hypothetical protein